MQNSQQINTICPCLSFKSHQMQCRDNNHMILSEWTQKFFYCTTFLEGRVKSIAFSGLKKATFQYLFAAKAVWPWQSKTHIPCELTKQFYWDTHRQAPSTWLLRHQQQQRKGPSPCKDKGCDPQSKGAAAFSSPTAEVLLKPRCSLEGSLDPWVALSPEDVTLWIRVRWKVCRWTRRISAGMLHKWFIITALAGDAWGHTSFSCRWEWGNLPKNLSHPPPAAPPDTGQKFPTVLAPSLLHGVLPFLSF